ncbi:MAG: tRNA 4-thiouridine(8) synthase ThiI [Planctomycetota bacterium]|nr:tRNA 4-thiouridine(8) synthase ThiI [Planctomycetota bacterium]
MTRALGLYSGGLDSMIAAKLMLEQGIEVTALNFSTPFFGSERARITAEQLGIELIVEDITEEHFEIVRSPRFGFGKNMNPCMDCHTMMYRLAGQMMEREGYDFIFTGEVLGQRPFSQNKHSIRQIAEKSGYEDDILRPLCARLFKPTRPEREGLVDRDRLLDISGRSRRRQIALAKKWGLEAHSGSAGGCLLTDPQFSARLREAMRDDPDMPPRDVEILKYGRHFRLTPGCRLAVGKTQGENITITKVAREKSYVLATVESVPSPTAAFTCDPNEEQMRLAARIIGRYADIPSDEEFTLIVWNEANDWRKEITAKPFSPEESKKYLIGLKAKGGG